MITVLSLTLIPSAIVLFLHFTWIHAAIHSVILFGFCVDRFTLTLHNTSHRPLFKSEWPNYFIPVVLGPFIGQSPFAYYAHHVGMHHPEENMWEDDSTTLPFKRDRVDHFLHYFLRFFFLGIFNVNAYLLRKNRKKLAIRCMVGEASFVAIVGTLLYFKTLPALVVFAFPFFMIRLMMMMGNWGQHAFVDENDPTNPYRSTITCIESRYNRRAFNDGYHIGHHLSAKMHWTDLPVEFEKNKAKYAAEGAIIFRGVDFFIVTVLLLTRQYKKLASCYVPLDGKEHTEEEIIALLKSRLNPVVHTTPETTPLAAE